MKAEIRRKIEQALAQASGEQPSYAPTPLSSQTELAIVPEREYSIEEIAQRHGLTYHAVWRAVKGKPGYRIYGKKRGARVTESRYRSFVAEAINKGLAA